MDLIGRAVAWGYDRPRVLPVAAPGATAVRLAFERFARERGWPTAASPAAADVLVACGEPDGGLEETVATVWRQLPEPRARVTLTTAAVAGALERARAVLVSRATRGGEPPARHRGRPMHDAHGGPGAHAGPDGPDAPRGGGDAEGGRQPGNARRGREQRNGGGRREGQAGFGPEAHRGREGHEGHEGTVAGLPMAERGPDRDGLRLDRLHLALGPVLPHWPAGLRLRLTVQGDVVQEASAEVAGHARAPRVFWDEAPRSAAHLDGLARCFAVAGAERAAARCALLRDEVLGGARLDPRRIPRGPWRLLGRMTDGLGTVTPEDARRHGLGEAVTGDVTARLRRRIRAAAEDGPLPDTAGVLELLPGLVTGAELAAVRLIVASLDPDLDRIVVGAPHG